MASRLPGWPARFDAMGGDRAKPVTERDESRCISRRWPLLLGPAFLCLGIAGATA